MDLGLNGCIPRALASSAVACYAPYKGVISAAIHNSVLPGMHQSFGLSREYGPQRKRYDDERPGGWRRTYTFDYSGIGRLGKNSLEPMKRLYVREGGVNRPVGHICEQGHVVLDQPPEGPAHVVTKTWPPKVVCTVTGEVVSTGE